MAEEKKTYRFVCTVCGFEVEAVMRSHRYADATVRFFKKEDSPVIEKQQRKPP